MKGWEGEVDFGMSHETMTKYFKVPSKLIETTAHVEKNNKCFGWFPFNFWEIVI